jgi:phosphatidylserine decarboxylase
MPIAMMLINDRYFAYGGSTIVVVFPKELIECVAFFVFRLQIDFIVLVSFDQDLVSNSEKPIETLVKVGDILCVIASC